MSTSSEYHTVSGRGTATFRATSDRSRGRGRARRGSRRSVERRRLLARRGNDVGLVLSHAPQHELGHAIGFDPGAHAGIDRRDVGADISLEVLRIGGGLPAERLRDVGVDASRTQRADADPVGKQIEPERIRDADHCVLGGAVRAESCLSLQPRGQKLC